MPYRPLALMCLAATLTMSMGNRGIAQVQSDSASGVVGRTVRVVITPGVYDTLARLAEDLQVETVRCLIGVERGDSLIIDLAWEPEIEDYSRHHVRYRRCPLATMALWHNHIAQPDMEPWDMCYLSQTDIGEALQFDAPPLQVVQVGAEVMCWWTQNQVVQSRQALKLDALPSQLMGGAARQLPQCSAAEEGSLNGVSGRCAARTVAQADPRPEER